MRKCLPSDEVLRFSAQFLVVREVQVTLPVNNFAVRVVRLLCAERRPADQTLEHNRSHAPPITREVIALAGKDFWCNVVWCTDCRVRQLSPTFTPSIDLRSIGDGEVDLVEIDGLTIKHGGA